MEDKKKPNHYNYQPLDEFFAKGDDPKAVGNQLDEIMADIVYLARDEDDFGRALTYHHYILRSLRDIFWKLEKQSNS